MFKSETVFKYTPAFIQSSSAGKLTQSSPPTCPGAHSSLPGPCDSTSDFTSQVCSLGGIHCYAGPSIFCSKSRPQNIRERGCSYQKYLLPLGSFSARGSCMRLLLGGPLAVRSGVRNSTTMVLTMCGAFASPTQKYPWTSK